MDGKAKETIEQHWLEVSKLLNNTHLLLDITGPGVAVTLNNYLYSVEELGAVLNG